MEGSSVANSIIGVGTYSYNVLGMLNFFDINCFGGLQTQIYEYAPNNRVCYTTLMEGHGRSDQLLLHFNVSKLFICSYKFVLILL